ncbi:UNVERIFIED_CONTAM: hypothetical protein HDU68_000919, partial [Siphonaria sp. JEL0065]
MSSPSPKQEPIDSNNHELVGALPAPDGKVPARRAKRLRVVDNSDEQELDRGSFQAETYFGFIEDEMDAIFVIEGTVQGLLEPFRGTTEDMANVIIKSGTVIVVPEKGSLVKRWR